MAALPSSLRRPLFILLGLSMSVLVMVFYWNQNTPRTSSTLMGSFYMPVNHQNPPETTWTYKCLTDRCIREHAKVGEKRVPFMSCAMLCGSLNVWPLPTLKAEYSSKSLTFDLDNIEMDVKTKFDEAKKLMLEAFNIFMFDLRHLTGKEPKNPVEPTEINQKYIESTEENSNKGNDINVNNRNCDINKIVITAEIFSSPDRYVHLDVDESYELNVTHVRGNLKVHISAPSFFGARHALSSLQQLVWLDDDDDLLRILSTVYIKDKPKFKFRGLMLDTSRNYFSVDTIKRTLVGMAHSKLNRFHWHITDTQSFPYSSKTYPQMAKYGAYSSKEIYTFDDIKEIAEFARVRGIQVLPEIDAPAHSGNGWDWGPKYGLDELALCVNQQPWSYYCGEPPCGQLNPKNNNTYLVLEKLYSELLEATGPTDFFHIGGDEVNLDCWSQYFNETDLKNLWCDFMLKAFERLKIANNNNIPRMVAVWSSGLTSSQCLSPRNFAVQLWGGSDWQENYSILQNGYNVIMSHVDAWYLDCGFGSWRMTGDGACSPYTTWQHVYKHRPWEKMRLETNRMKQILGGEACLWTEQVDEGNVDSRLWPRAAAIAERLWTDPADVMESDIMPKEVFRRISIFRNRLLNYGIEAEPIFPKYCAQNQDECA